MNRNAPRAVFDTNLLVSYLLVHRPPIAALLDIYLAQGCFTLITALELLPDSDGDLLICP